MVQHFVICKGGTCLWVGSGAYNELVRGMLEQSGLWQRTITKLAELCPKPRGHSTALYNAKRKRIQAWISLGVSLGLYGSRQFAPLPESEGCHWKDCPYSHQVRNISDLTLRGCSGCQGVSYCSKECQTKDWKAGHKHACKASETK